MISKKTKKGASHLTTALLSADANNARIIGLTSDRQGTGVSLAARSLAEGYGNFGRRALLVLASAAPAGGGRPTKVELGAINATETPNVWECQMLVQPGQIDAAPYRAALKAAAAEYAVVIVDLPPAAPGQGRPTAEALAPAAACEVVYLVCQTGKSARTDVLNCVDACRIGGVTLGGIILNDGRLPASSFLIFKPSAPDTQIE